MKNCPKCRKSINNDYLFCPMCGENLKKCYHCGKERPEMANSCPYCGKPTNLEATVQNSPSSEDAVCKSPIKVATVHASEPSSPGQPNNSVISKDAYVDIINRFSLMHDKHIGHNNSPNPNWIRGETRVFLSDEWEHWVGHDDTIEKTIKLTFSKAKTVVSNVEWSTESEWPCSGEALLFDKSWSKEPEAIWDSSYSYVTHKAWLLKEPFGLSGIWQFEYEASGRRY